MQYTAHTIKKKNNHIQKLAGNYDEKRKQTSTVAYVFCERKFNT